LKGIEKPVTVERVIAEKDVLTLRKGPLNLLGREKEIQILDKFVAGVSAGKCGLLQLFG